jgi:hypothetical protein
MLTVQHFRVQFVFGLSRSASHELCGLLAEPSQPGNAKVLVFAHYSNGMQLKC